MAHPTHCEYSKQFQIDAVELTLKGEKATPSRCWRSMR